MITFELQKCLLLQAVVGTVSTNRMSETQSRPKLFLQTPTLKTKKPTQLGCQKIQRVVLANSEIRLNITQTTQKVYRHITNIRVVESL